MLPDVAAVKALLHRVTWASNSDCSISASEARDGCSFADLPSKQNGAWVLGITPSMMRKISWVIPVFVCLVKFTEWRRDVKLRQPVFHVLREDKSPRAVRRERPA